MDLGAATWTEIEEPIIVVPVGACEQHGPHLPLHTDTVIATALAADLAAHRTDCVVAPPIAVSASGEHAGFPGTLSIGTEAMIAVVVELVRSADWATGVVFVNGHGGNLEAMQRAAAICRAERRRVLVWWPVVAGGDPHAGHTETSLMLALAPDEVRLERSVAGPVPATADIVHHGVQPLSATGVLGDPTAATEREGVRLFRDLADRLASAVHDWVG